jgi:hypothetical protein
MNCVQCKRGYYLSEKFAKKGDDLGKYPEGGSNSPHSLQPRITTLSQGNRDRERMTKIRKRRRIEIIDSRETEITDKKETEIADTL